MITKRRLYLSETELEILKRHLQQGIEPAERQLLKRVEILINSNQQRENKVHEPLDPIIDDIPF